RRLNGPRTSSQNRIANSVKCAALRISKFVISTEKEDIPGNNHRRIGVMIAEVLAAENPEVENVKMTAAQTAIGSHSANNDMCGGCTAIARPLIECTYLALT